MNWYMEALLGVLPNVLKTGQWFSSAGTGRVNYVTREDCARAAAGALLKQPSNQTYTVTGPEALAAEEIAAIASGVAGKPLAVVEVTDEQLGAGAKAAGVPDFVIDNFIVPFDRNTREGKIDLVTDAVEKLWGSNPTSVREFLTQNRPALA
jgi:NAD(P)H dehydrogenase (quinone)